MTPADQHRGAGAIALFPQPRQMSFGGGEGSTVEVEAAHDPTLQPQGYELAITPDGTKVRYADQLGLRYARQTLAQLAAAGAVPTGQVRDWPDFAQRGFMLDISRDRVPTMATLEWLIARLAQLRYNHLELYTEHTFAYADHQVVWRDASPITPDELRRLDQLCDEHGIELSANQSTFGHMDRWLAHPAYNERAECPDGSEHPELGRRLPAWSLEPTPRNAAFAVDLVREMAGNLRSKRVNVCADEPFDLGLGKSRALVEQNGRASVFVEHLRRVIDPLADDGYQVLFWGDALARHPESVPQLPPDGTTAVVWTYDAPDPDGPSLDALLGPEMADLLGLPDQANLGFASYVRTYADAGYPFWVAPGTSSWNSLVGRWSNARANLLDAAIVGRDRGASGYLVTDWGDNGHPQPLAVSLLAAAYGAGVAWCRATNGDLDVTPVVDGLLDAHHGVGSRLAQLGDLYRHLGVTAINGSPLMLAMASPNNSLLGDRLDAVAADTTEDLISEAIDHFAATPFRGPRAEAVAAELVATCRLLRHGLWRLRCLRGDGGKDAALLAADFEEAADLYRHAWLTTSRPGGLDDSVAKLNPA